MPGPASRGVEVTYSVLMAGLFLQMRKLEHREASMAQIYGEDSVK